ncbi:MAG: response regulator [Bacteroidetes bacterium]|nr:MAG: response regulator [Bacteroidota bacterium]
MENKWEDKVILIVDDIKINYILITRQLRKYGASFVWLKDGTEVVKYVQSKKQVDLILMDVRMPNLNGVEATIVIKKLNPKIPIIMQTACVMGDDCDKLEDSQCDDIIYKPIIAEKLIEMINKFI